MLFPVPEAVPFAFPTGIAVPGALPRATEDLEVDGVPDVSAELYRAVLDGANAAPGWLGDFAVFFTEAGVVALGLLLVFGWWRARGEDSRAMAAALLAPVVTILAYAISEVAKLVIEQERPCRAVPGARPLAECPGVGDWSFPSNHSTIAGAAAMAVFVCRRGKLGVAALCLGALVAFSRVVVGAHYPHDVLVGFLLGVAVIGGALDLVARRTADLVERYRPHPLLGRVLGHGPAGTENPAGASDDDTQVLVATPASVATANEDTTHLSATHPSATHPDTTHLDTAHLDTAPTRPIPRLPRGHHGPGSRPSTPPPPHGPSPAPGQARRH